MPHNKISVSTKNPCNQFMISYLIKARNRNSTSAKDFKFFMYSKVIDSVRKYPLPIICEQQVRMLAGVGDFLADKLVNVIRDHYRKFLKYQNQQIISQDKHQNKLMVKSSEIQNYYSFKSQVPLSQISQYVSQMSEKSQQILEQRDKCPLPGDNYSLNCDKLSVKSEKISIKINKYKPKPNSQAAQVLQAMYRLKAHQNSVTKKDIIQQIQKNNQKLKQWKSTKQTLLKYDFIKIDPNVDQESLSLTNKANSYLNQNQEKSVIKQSKKKIIDKIEQLKKQTTIRTQEQLQASQNSQSFSSKSKLIYSSNSYLSLTKSNQQGISGKIILVIDNRQIKNKQQQKNYFQEKLNNKYGIQCMKSNISLGDFLWVYQDNRTNQQLVLDYVIQRKKADDLASSILDGRYKQQKYRLRNSGISNIIYLYEGHASQSAMKSEKQLQNALMKTRIYQQFKVYKTKSINQTTKLLAYMTKQLTKKLLKDQLETICSLREFNKKYSKKNSLTVENLFGMGIKMFPNIGKSGIKSILKYYKTYRELYEGLKQFQNNKERFQFLTNLLKGGRTQTVPLKLIVEFLFPEQSNNK